MAATKDSWKRKPFVQGSPIPYQDTFSRAEFDRIRRGLIPEEMEDKWFVYFEEPYLFFHHSWTGEPIYRVALKENEDNLHVVEAACVLEILKTSDPEYEAKLLDFLISNLLLGKSKPFPIPPGASEQQPGLLQHVVAGTMFPEGGWVHRRGWWRFWQR